MRPRNLYYSEISSLRDALETRRNGCVQEEPLNSHSPYPFIVQKSRIYLVNISDILRSTECENWHALKRVSMQLSPGISNAIDRFGTASE